MARISDHLFGIERDLEKYPPGTPGGALNRRLILRKLLETVAAESRQEGYSDGLRDAQDAAFAEAELARAQEQDDGGDDA